jgi:metal-responsive CopG/Arc/MetJ family transcriptional regulator
MTQFMPLRESLVQTSIRLPKSLMKEVDRIAKDAKRTRTEVIVYMIQRGVAAEQSARATK